MNIGIHPLNQHTIFPEYSTTHAACFDMFVNLGDGCQQIEGYSEFNRKIVRYAFPPENVTDKNSVSARIVTIHPRERLLIPTGIQMDIPVGYSVRLHSRSGNSLKRGLVLINSEGIIDSDYRHQVFIPIVNLSGVEIVIQHGERICQAEIVPVVKVTGFPRIDFPLEQITNRTGGFGSTGV